MGRRRGNNTCEELERAFDLAQLLLCGQKVTASLIAEKYGLGIRQAQRIMIIMERALPVRPMGDERLGGRQLVWSGEAMKKPSPGT